MRLRGVVPGFSTMSCTPDKLGENVLTSGSNRVEGLDGSLAHGNDNVMFPVDAVVEIVFGFMKGAGLTVWSGDNGTRPPVQGNLIPA